ncbi:DUF6933 domain-containing protein [Leeia aquatica]|uniref:DUF6933 domain-containing protein n=1 Tax=Leeia aquatica TaxID=2725557 RepID=A0A847S9W2_9NEIS|nr:hypothetical protein [Leeia aquatica]NLR75655.1 hypothetical protein [Leeia aquatica]
MLTLHCTQAAARALSQTRQGRTHSPVRDVAPVGALQGWRWQLHAATVSRRTVFILMEQHSRFAVALWGIRKGDYAALLQQFWQRIANHLLWLNDDVGGLTESEADAALAECASQHRQTVFLHGGDRSVQQHLNQALAEVRLALSGETPPLEDLLAAAQLDDYLNRGFRQVGRQAAAFVPADAFYLHWLRHAARLDDAALEAVQHRQQALRQAHYAALWGELEA